MNRKYSSAYSPNGLAKFIAFLAGERSPHRSAADLVTLDFQGAVEFGFAVVLVAAMNDGEQVLQGLQQATTVSSVSGVRMLGARSQFDVQSVIIHALINLLRLIE